MYCITCGQENEEHAKFCLKCGHPFSTTNDNTGNPNPANNKMAPLPAAVPQDSLPGGLTEEEHQTARTFATLALALVLFSIFAVYLASEHYRNIKRNLIISNYENLELRAYELTKYKSNNKLFRPPAKNTIQTNLEKIIKQDVNIANNKFYDKLNNLSTGRLTKWSFIVLNNKRITFGYGPNKDRYFFKKTIKEKIGTEDKSLLGANDAASGIFYQYISAGIIGIIGFAIFGLLLLYRIYKLNFKNQNYIEKTYTSLFVFLSFRIFFENGYFIFGIDFLILLICLILIKPNKINNI